VGMYCAGCRIYDSGLNSLQDLVKARGSGFRSTGFRDMGFNDKDAKGLGFGCRVEALRIRA